MKYPMKKIIQENENEIAVKNYEINKLKTDLKYIDKKNEHLYEQLELLYKLSK
ncbi:10400_t:CDS:2 [Dentiscutata erythropus]|uniref:10400_t:CDS:1 n=1 Tax=Dentiscutata erythropus TaxID=1348616 RepID=A0A9N8Z378_9GLOM|nr:10400_t:CDS:2 [Dentiscutata erythropus]